MAAGKHDHLFGGAPGAAERALKGMKRRYGPEKGQLVFDATVIKRERGGRGSAPKRGGKPFEPKRGKRSLAQRLLGG